MGGKASKNNLKDSNFNFPMTNVTFLSIFCMHVQEEDLILLELKNTSILNISELLLSEK